MSVRGLGLVALAAVVGVAGGYAYADSSLAAPDPSGTPAPVVAAGPAFPTTPEKKTLPDSDLPPMPTSFETRTAKVGEPGTGVEVTIPQGWSHGDFSSTLGVRFFGPGHEDWSYSVRVNPLSTTQSTAQMVAARVAQLPLDTSISQLKFEEQTDDTLVFTYLAEQHRVEQVIRWVSINGGPAIAEIAASGRLVDDPGMKTLTAIMAAGTVRQPPKPKKSASPSGSATPSDGASPSESTSPSDGTSASPSS